MSTITTRAGKGSPLTHDEVDDNFTNLNTDKLQSGDTAASLTVNTVDINGGTIDGATVDGRDVGADGSKLDGIEAGADVTDTANVTAAGALMDSELTDEAVVKALDQGVATTDSPSFAGVTATTADINGGSIDGTAINTSTIDGTVIGGSTPAAISGTTGTFSGDLTVDTDTLFVDASTNNVGIGTSSPSATLEVIESSSGRTWSPNSTSELLVERAGSVALTLSTNDAGSPRINFGNETSEIQGRIQYSNPSDVMTFDTAGSEAMRIDSSGNVGIGTSSPSEALTITGNIAFTDSPSKLSVRRGNQDSLLDFDFPDLTDTEGGVRFFRGTNTTSDCIVRFHSGDGTTNTDHVITCGGGNSFFQANGGNVGIGTSSPSATLDVDGSLSKNSGSFKIDHPIKPDTHHLVHSFVEGPQADNLYRGKVTLVDGQATVNLDEAGRMTQGTFAALNGNVQCFTTNEDGWTQVRGSVSGNILTIEAQDPTCVDEVSWLVIGERHDQHMIDTEWTDENGRVITEPEKTLEGAE